MARSARAATLQIARVATLLDPESQRLASIIAAAKGYSKRETYAQIMNDAADELGIPSGYETERRFAAAASLKGVKSIELLTEAIRVAAEKANVFALVA